MKMKRFFALMLALALSLTMLQGVAFGADDYDWDAASGKLTIKTQTGMNSWKTGSGASTATLKEVIIEDGVTSIGADAFRNCTSLASVTFAEGSQLDTIGDSAFKDCRGLASIAIPAGVTSIENSAFYYCYNLTSVVFAKDSKLKTIGDSAFNGCSGLASLAIPAGVTSIGDGAFRTCKRLASIVLPNGITSIGEGTFSECTDLTSITIPAGVASIGNGAFLECEELTTITFMGSNLASIHDTAFDNAGKLTTINLAGNYDKNMVDILANLLTRAANHLSPYVESIALGNLTINYNARWTNEQAEYLKTTMDSLTGKDGGKIKPENIKADATLAPPTGGGSGSIGGGTAGAGAWYIGTLNSGGGQPTYTQIVDEMATTAMLETGSVVTVTGQSPTGIIVKFAPTALSGHSTVTINNSIQDVTLTATQIANLVAKADGGVIHITLKETADGVSISATAGGVQVTL